MSLTAIGKLANPPKYQVPIHYTIVHKRHCDPPCLPILTKIMQAAINELCNLPNSQVKCISPPGPSVLLARPQSTQDQRGVHSHLVDGLVVFCWQVSFPTTSLLSQNLHSESFSAPHPVELLCPQSGSHASNYSLRNKMDLHHAVPSLYHPPDHQAYLKQPQCLKTPVIE
jgi:hypothetical protein